MRRAPRCYMRPASTCIFPTPASHGSNTKSGSSIKPTKYEENRAQVNQCGSLICNTQRVLQLTLSSPLVVYTSKMVSTRTIHYISYGVGHLWILQRCTLGDVPLHYAQKPYLKKIESLRVHNRWWFWAFSGRGKTRTRRLPSGKRQSLDLRPCLRRIRMCRRGSREVCICASRLAEHSK